jgi:rare lipoprotein A
MNPGSSAELREALPDIAPARARRYNPQQPMSAPRLTPLVIALLATACETASPSVRPDPEVHPSAASHSTASKHGSFDPRDYYSKRALEVHKGGASYYADSLAGRRTANGERYDPNAYTAAHRSYPFGTVLRVTRVQTGAWVLVRVNDRGPYASGRVIDLSKQAAKRLSMLRDGVVPVRLEILEWGPRH